jgi:hypothetical protein
VLLGALRISNNEKGKSAWKYLTSERKIIGSSGVLEAGETCFAGGQLAAPA